MVPDKYSPLPSTHDDADALPRSMLVGRRTLVAARWTLLTPVRTRIPTRVLHRSARAVHVRRITVPGVPVPVASTVAACLAAAATCAPLRIGRRTQRSRPSAASRIVSTLALVPPAVLPVIARLRPRKMPFLPRLLQLQKTPEPALHPGLDAAIHDLRQ